MTESQDAEESEFRRDLQTLINRHSRENDSGTPDFILARYLDQCLAAFNDAMQARARWYGFEVPGLARGKPAPGDSDRDICATCHGDIQFFSAETAVKFQPGWVHEVDPSDLHEPIPTRYA